MSNEPLSAKAYRNIQNRIYSGTLSVGSVVSEVSLAGELGVSRTPVREAIRRLCGEGLLEQIPRYGTVVRKQTRREIIELYQLREALESYAVGVAARLMKPHELESLEDFCGCIREMADQLKDSGNKVLGNDEMGRFLAIDMAFHTLIIRAAGNGRITKLVTESKVLTGCFFRTNRRQHTLEIVQGAYNYHVKILGALKEGDAEAAGRFAAEHIRAGQQGALLQYDQMTGIEPVSESVQLDLPDAILNEFAGFDWKSESSVAES